jgi:hypothetical protein
LDELLALAHQFAELPDLGRGCPSFWKATHAQQVDEVFGVTLVVLHPAIAKALDAERMSQVDLGAALVEDVDRPVPAVGGLEDHLGPRTRLGQFSGQGDGVV